MLKKFKTIFKNFTDILKSNSINNCLFLLIDNYENSIEIILFFFLLYTKYDLCFLILKYLSIFIIYFKVIFNKFINLSLAKMLNNKNENEFIIKMMMI